MKTKAILSALCVGLLLPAAADVVAEPARTLPVIEETDVLVVGGGFAAAAAALEAKAAGANVFVVMPRQNPADDLISTRRLWREADDTGLDDPLISSVFPVLSAANFTYSPSVVAVSPHQDDQHVVLKDGVWNDAANNSAQYGSKDEPCDEVTIDVSPAAGSYNIVRVKLCYYSGGGDYGGYNTSGITLKTSAGDDIAGDLVAKDDSGGKFKVWQFTPTTAIPAGTQFKIVATTAEGAVRQLVGEVLLETDQLQRQDSTKPVYLFKAIDGALLSAGVPYFTGSTVCDVVRDVDGKLAGVVVANRSGRQAITAKAVVDASEWGVVARKVAALKKKDADDTVFTQVVTLAADNDLVLPAGYTAVEKPSQIFVVTINDNKPSNGAPSSYAAKTLAISKSFPLASSDYLSVNAVLNAMRGDLWHKSVADWSEKPFFVPPESITGQSGDPYRPAGVDNLWVAGMLADVSRADAAKLALLGRSVSLGRQVGAAAAALSSAAPVLNSAEPGEGQGAIREDIRRPLHVGASSATFTPAAAELPVLADVDVVVVGGGTAGAPAAIGASGEGKSVWLCEWLYCLGGTTTEGRIGTYYHGVDCGFTKNSIDPGTRGANAIGWVFSETKSEWFRRTAVQNGATVVYGSFAEGAYVDGADAQGRAKVKGVVVVLPDGTRGVVKAKVVVDSTGNADVAAAAGAETAFLSPAEFAMQGSAASPHVTGRSYYNTDVGFLNCPDAGDLFTFALRARLGLPAEKVWNLSHVHTGARERRRIVGDYVLTPEDELIGRTYSDTIMTGKSDYDMHGFSTTSLMMFHNRPKSQEYTADLPYRSLLPRNLDGVLVTGLAISADRDAMPIVRMQRDVQNQGYAAGLAAAAAADAGATRAIDVRALQQKLVAANNLNARVLSETDSGCDAAKLAQAVENLDTDFLTLPWIVAYPAEALPLVQTAFASAEQGSNHEKALACALLLLGDESGYDVVSAAFANSDVTQGSNFKGLGNYGRQTSGFDLLLYALSKSSNPKAEAVIARRVPELVASNSTATILPMSHFRMASLAAESLRSERIAAQLTSVVGRNVELSNKSKSDPVAAVSYSSENAMDAERTQTIRELAHLRARHRFGDASAKAGLEAYLSDYRTIYAEWAKLALAQPQLGETIGTWEGPDTLVLDLGKPSEPAALTGKVRVVDATVRVTGAPDMGPGTVEYELIPDGSFEPLSPITTGDVSARDKRGGDATALFHSDSWVFENKAAGIAADGSYLMEQAGDNKAREGNLPESDGGAHAAFIAYRTDKTQGRIHRTILIPETGEYRLSFYMASRTYSGTTYNSCLFTKIGDTVVDNYPSADNVGKVQNWTKREIELGELAEGEHTLAFGVPPDKGELWMVIDLVKIGKVRTSAVGVAFPKGAFAGLSLDLGPDAELELALEGLAPVTLGGLRVGGVSVSGLVDSSSAFASGTGSLQIPRRGLEVNVR